MAELSKELIGYNPVWLAEDCVRMTGYMGKPNSVLFVFEKLENYVEICYATWEVILAVNGKFDNEKQANNIRKRLFNPVQGVPVQVCVRELDLNQADNIYVRSKRIQKLTRKIGYEAEILHLRDVRERGLEGYPSEGYWTPKRISQDLYEVYAEKGLCNECPSETCWECF